MNHSSPLLCIRAGEGVLFYSLPVSFTKTEKTAKTAEKQRKTPTFSLCDMRGYVSMYIGITYALFMCVNA
jgi:hypothetical protein